MEKWFNEVVLETDNIKLQPINITHKQDLINAAADGNLSDLWFTSVPTINNIDSYIAKAIEDFELNKGLAFVVIDKKTNTIIGTTRYTNATPEHRRLEIGYTWYSQAFQKTYVNSECKLLLLTHAFEVLKAVAVEFRTHWYNFSSRNAIARLGAKQDGVLRNHQIMSDGSFRDTVVFSIIESEWKTCKHSLNYKIEQIHKKTYS
jgi:RimJ/RimL family protein N-acetyltransferase